MRMTSIAVAVFATVFVAACSNDDALVAVVDYAVVNPGEEVRIEPLANDVWTITPSLQLAEANNGPIEVQVAGETLLIRDVSATPGSRHEVPYTIGVGERLADGIVVVTIADAPLVIDEVVEVIVGPPLVLPSEVSFSVVLPEGEGAASYQQDVFVTNISDEARGGVTTELSQSSIFHLDSGCSSTDDECLTGVVFDPPSAGSWNAELVVTFPDGSETMIPISATAIDAVEKRTAFNLSRNLLNLGSRNVGGATLSGVVGITNSGTETIEIVVEPLAGIRHELKCPQVLRPLDECSLEIYVSTATAKTVDDLITLSALGAADQTLRIVATVNSVSIPTRDPGVGLTPSSVSLSLGSPSQTVTVTNNGDVLLTNLDIAVSVGLYELTNNDCKKDLPVGGECEFEVSISPNALSLVGLLEAGEVTVSTAEIEARLVVSGSAAAADPSIALDPASIFVNDNHEPRSVAIRNNGNVPLEGFDIDQAGRFGVLGDFEILSAGRCEEGLRVGGTCFIRLELISLPDNYIGGRAFVDELEIRMGPASAILTVQLGATIQ